MKYIDIDKLKNSKEPYGKSKDKALTPSERKILELLIEKKEDLKSLTLFYVMCYCGLRIGEVEQLRKEWLNKEKSSDNSIKTYLTIHIPMEARNIRNKRLLWRPKTKRKRDVYVFDTEVYSTIYSYFQAQEGFYISARQIRNIVYRWGKMINKNISPHALRATCQNYLKYELDLRTEVISYMLGHESVDTTQKYYDTKGKAQVESYLLQKILKNK